MKDTTRKTMIVFLVIVLALSVTVLIFYPKYEKWAEKKEDKPNNKDGSGKETEKLSPKPVQWVLICIDPNEPEKTWPMEVSNLEGGNKSLTIKFKYSWNRLSPPREGLMSGTLVPNGSYVGAFQDWEKETNFKKFKKGEFSLKQTSRYVYKGTASIGKDVNTLILQKVLIE